MIEQLGLMLLAAWYAWRYSRTEIDPDWAMFNLRAFTGALYGRDFLDCKTPLIHLWYYGIARLVGANVRSIRFVHHYLISLPGIWIGGWAGLAFIVLINSGWLLAFHGNVGQVPAGLILLALSVNDPWISSALIFLAVGFEPKLFPALSILPLSGWWLPLFTWAATGAGVAWVVRHRWPMYWGWLWESNITITGRMVKMRRELVRKGMDMTKSASLGLMYTLPWLCLAAITRPDWRYWVPVAGYLVLIAAGIAVRNNHYLVLAPWIALALPAWAVMCLCVVDWVSAFGYLGDIWGRFYPGLKQINEDAREAGEYLKDKAGRLWVNGIHTGIYLYAEKAPVFGLCEQVEIRENADERRAIWLEGMRNNPPEWVVEGSRPGWKFTRAGYSLAAETELSKIYRRM